MKKRNKNVKVGFCMYIIGLGLFVLSFNLIGMKFGYSALIYAILLSISEMIFIHGVRILFSSKR